MALQPRAAPGTSYQFFSEKDADLTAVEGRLEWFCASFNTSRPLLEYDPQQPGSLLLTDELLEWASVEGVSLDWIVFGHVGGPLAVYREKYKKEEAR